GGPWLEDVTDLLNGTPERRARRFSPSDFDEPAHKGGDGPGDLNAGRGGSTAEPSGGGGGAPVRSLSPADLGGLGAAPALRLPEAGGQGGGSIGQEAPTVQPSLQPHYGQTPLPFERNVGQ